MPRHCLWASGPYALDWLWASHPRPLPFRWNPDTGKTENGIGPEDDGGQFLSKGDLRCTRHAASKTTRHGACKLRWHLMTFQCKVLNNKADTSCANKSGHLYVLRTGNVLGELSVAPSGLITLYCYPRLTPWAMVLTPLTRLKTAREASDTS